MHRPTYQAATYPANTCGAATATQTCPLNPKSNLRMNPSDCRCRAASRDPGAMGYPTGVWALFPWWERPMTPHFDMLRPGTGGRSPSSPA